jgi:hypothetical protein
MGQAWRGYVSRERHVADWIISRGLPAVGARVLLWLTKLVLLELILYFSFWLALLLLLAVVATGLAGRRYSQEEFEWPFMDMEEVRKFPDYDPNVHNDASHEMFEDD